MTAKKTSPSKTTAKKTKPKKTVAGKAATAEKPIKAVAAKALAKKTAAKKIAQKKAIAKKSSAKKVASKKAGTQAATKKAAKPAAKKTAVKKVAAKKAVAKKPVARTMAAKKASLKVGVKKLASKKASVTKSVSLAPAPGTQIKQVAKPKTTGKKTAGRKLPVVKVPIEPQAVSLAPAKKPVAPAPRHKANPETPRTGSVVRVRQTVTRVPLPGVASTAERPKATTVAKPIAGARNLRLVARPKSSRSPARGLSAGAVTALAAAATGRDVKPRMVLDVALSEQRLRQNIRISIFFLEAWLRSGGADSTPDLIEMAGAAEAARSQIWRWLDQAAQFEDGRTIDAVNFEKALHREMLALREDLGEAVFNAGLFQTAAELFVNLALAPDFHDFPDHVTTH